MKYINKSTVHGIVSLFVFGLFGVVFTAGYWMTGGKHKNSPDGRFKLDITAKLDPTFRYSYTICLYRISSRAEKIANTGDANERQREDTDDESEQLLEKTILTPYTTTVVQPREIPEMICWSSGSDFVDVVVHEQRLCRLFPK